MNTVNIDQRFFTADLNAEAATYETSIRGAWNALKSGTCEGHEFLGWYNYPQNHGFGDAQRIHAFIEGLTVPFDLVLVVGVGGSYLGCRAVADALSHSYSGQLGPLQMQQSKYKQIVYAGHHLCESELLDLLDLLAQRLPLVVVVSKSGQTTEPAIAFRIIREYLVDRFGEASANDRTIAITDSSQGSLRQLADQKSFKSFEIPTNVGGRYSVMTPVGLVPLALAGYNIDALLNGANQIFEELERSFSEPDDLGTIHPALQYAACRIAAYRSGKCVELLAYSHPKLKTLVEWWKQLFGESEGKDGKGIFPAGVSYTTDLHSLGQLIQSGERNLFETFLCFDSCQQTSSYGRQLKVPRSLDDLDRLSYLEGRTLNEINSAAERGTKIAHFDGGVPCLQIDAPSYDEFGIGKLMAFFEVACAISSLLLGVNPFDQPGVESYKKNLFGLLGKPGFEDLGQHLRQRIQYIGLPMI